MPGSLFAPQNTLAFQLARPMCVRQDIRNVSFSKAAQWMKSQMKSTVKSDHPELNALQFYLFQHAMGVIRSQYGVNDPLPEPALLVCNKYHEICNKIAARMFYYLVHICLHEARHLHPPDGWWGKIKSAFGGSVHDLLAQARSNPDQILSGVLPEKVTVGQYATALEFTFHHGGWSSAYGGPKWGAVAKAMRDFIEGTMTPEMLLDMAFSLSHNTSLIFDKGGVFHPQNQSSLYLILDVQASGQIPYLFNEAANFHGKEYVENARPLAQMVRPVIPDPDKPIDWYAVATASKGHYNYNSLKKMQAQKAGLNPTQAMQKEKQAELVAQKKQSAQFYNLSVKEQLPKIKRKKGAKLSEAQKKQLQAKQLEDAGSGPTAVFHIGSGPTAVFHISPINSAGVQAGPAAKIFHDGKEWVSDNSEIQIIQKGDTLLVQMDADLGTAGLLPIKVTAVVAESLGVSKGKK